MIIDYKAIGFKAGIEIHQQLDTHKLFCGCPSVIRDDDPDVVVKRKMRAVAGEIGDIDPAALHEFLRDRLLIYQAYTDTNCLVELDEEPPHPLNKEALEISLEISMLLNADVVDEVQVMRKTVIDGSNTSGFQRTMLVALDGYVDTGEGRVSIPAICLEEDAARKIGDGGGTTTYRLDRLGIPLIELGTDPDIKSPRHAREVAEKLGMVLRATGRVRRGLGTIRQDLNISIRGGGRVEVKGVGDLKLIAKVMENEVERQLMLLDVKKKLAGRGVKKSLLRKEFIDVSDKFRETESELLRKKLAEGSCILALPLQGFDGLLRDKLGPEMAQYARSMSDVKGILHSDELPGYGISGGEVAMLRKDLNLGVHDAFVLVIENEKTAKKALSVVVKRCRMAIDGVPEETRRSVGDGTSEFMRPLPGSARMYPETDEPLIEITGEELSRIKRRLPKLPGELKQEYLRVGLSEELANQVLRSRWNKSFMELVSEYSNVNPTLIATTLVSTPKEVRKRFGVDMGKVRVEHYHGIFKNLDRGLISRDSVLEILSTVAKNPGRSVDDIIQGEGITLVSVEEIDAAVDELIEGDRSFVKKSGLKAVGPLTGKIMAHFRGRADGNQVSSIIKKKIREI